MRNRSALLAPASAASLAVTQAELDALEASIPLTYVALQDQAFRGQLLAAGEGTLPRSLHLGAAGTGTGALRLSYWTARRTETCNQIRTNTSSTGAAATPTLCRMGIYSVDGSGNLTLLAACANDTTLWATPSTVYTRNLTSAFSKVGGQRYAAAALVVTGATAPTLQGASSFGVGVLDAAPRIAGQVAGQTDLPASIAIGSISASVGFHYVEVLP